MTVPLITPRDWHSPKPTILSPRPFEISPTRTDTLEVPISTAPINLVLEVTMRITLRIGEGFWAPRRLPYKGGRSGVCRQTEVRRRRLRVVRRGQNRGRLEGG